MVLTSHSVSGQGWERFYDFNDNEYGLEIYNNAIGGYSVFVNTLQSSAKDHFLQLDPEGNILLDVAFDTDSTVVMEISVSNALSNGDFIVAGDLRHTSQDDQATYLMRISANGKILWLKEYDATVDFYVEGVSPTTDGGFVLTGTKNFSHQYLMLMKTDSVGKVEWVKPYLDYKTTRGYDVIQCSDGGYGVLGVNFNGIFGPGADWWLLRTDMHGDTIWSRKYGDGAPDVGYALLETENKGFILAGNATLPGSSDGYSDAVVMHVDSTGKKKWVGIYEGPEHVYAYSIKRTSDQGYIISGQLNDSLTTGYTGYLLKIDKQGNQMWSRSFRNGELDVFYSAIEAPDGGFAVTGYHRGGANTETNLYVVKTDSLGNVLSSYLEGNIFWDKNQDCLLQAGEPPLDHFIIEATGKRNVKGISDPLGNFLMRLDTGENQIRVSSPNQYWEPCIPQYDIDFAPKDTVTTAFPMQSIVTCPYMMISVSTSALRRCFPGTYNIMYCNTGTASATNVMIHVEIDSFIIVNSASIPYTIINGIYSFQIDDVDPGECGSFNLKYVLSCTADLGMSHCITAIMTPDTICVPGAVNLSQTKECQKNRGSFDPNDKRAFVEGIERRDTVSPNGHIEYQIRFQNTGTDTAFQVIIYDTIRNELDIASVQIGASSHPYTFEIVRENILKFTFPGIMLPDSFINEPASNGYIKFSIGQKPDLEIGTIIKNSATIFFDFNKAVITPVSELVVEEVISIVEAPVKELYAIIAYPNPTGNIVFIKIRDCYQEVVFRLYDLTGREILRHAGMGPEISMDMKGLVPGPYHYNLFIANEYIAGGMVVRY